MNVVGSLLVVFALISSSFGVGYFYRDRAAQHERDKALREADKRHQAEVRQGRQAADQATAALVQLTDQFRYLEGLFHDLRHRVPLVASRPVVRAAACPAAPAPGDPAPPPRADAPIAQPEAVVTLELGGLTAGAVWMWNSALAGRDVPAGACGAADTTDAACAVDTGLPLDAAWANHEANAKARAADALRHQRLIDYLHDREKRKAPNGR